MPFGEFWAVAKDDGGGTSGGPGGGGSAPPASGPTSTDVHQDGILKVKCPKCGKKHGMAIMKAAQDPANPQSFSPFRFPSTPPSTLLQPVTALEAEGQEAASPNHQAVAPAANINEPGFGHSVTSNSDTPVPGSAPEATTPFHLPVPGL